MDGTTLITSLLVTGLLGSLGHCSGMCGPLVLMLGMRSGADAARGRRLGLHVTYHAARVAVYVVLGVALAALGGLLVGGSGLSGLEGWLSLVLGVGVIVFGLSYLGLRAGRGTLVPLAWLDRAMTGALRRRGAVAAAGLGALNGLLPCGLVYSALLVAAAAGSAATAAAGMGAFGAGTAPMLLLIGLGGSRLSPRARAAFQLAAGVLIVVVGVQLMLRGAAELGILSHAHLWRVALW